MVVASLKRSPAPAYPLTRQRFHGRMVVASLKPVAWVRTSRPTRAIPRPNGRGLIEARSRASRIPLIGCRFHGRMVVASLKHVSGRTECLPPGTIPRPNGRGLIEACTRAADPCRFPSIPRPNGRGLIEASAARGTARARGRFHGRMVVASLKRP